MCYPRLLERILAMAVLSIAAVLTCADAPGDQPATEQQSKNKELTPKQRERLQERDRLTAEAAKLRKEGKLTEAIANAEQVLAIEREVLGSENEEVAGSLLQLAEMYVEREVFDAARKAGEEVLAIQTKLHGEMHWQVTDARLALDTIDRVAGLDAKDRALLREADQLNAELERLYGEGKFRQALEPATKAVEIRARLLGETHPAYAESVNNLALLYKSLGDHSRAESLYDQALEIKRKTLGEKHPEYASSLNNLGLLYQFLRQHRRAEPLLLQASEIWKTALGEAHPEYAVSLNNLGVLYWSMADYARAETFYRQACEIWEAAVGKEHPDYASSLNNLADLYGSIGDYLRAEPLLLQSLDIRKKALRKMHPDYAHSLNSLAELYRNMGDYARAEPLWREALEIRKETFGETHSIYAMSLNNLGALYWSMGEYARAEPLLRQGLEIKRKALGESNADYAMSLNNLGLMYKTMGDYARAEPLIRQASEIWKKALTESHPDYARSVNNLAGLYAAMEEYDRAEPLYLQASEIWQKAVGEAHAQYAVSLNNLASLYESMGQYARAESLYRQACEIKKKALGEEHPDYATSLNGLAGLYGSMGEHARAELLYRQAFEIWKKTLREGHPNYAVSLNNLGRLHAITGDFVRAEPLLRQGLEIKRQNLELTFAAMSERQQLAMTKSLRSALDTYIALAARAALPGEQAYAPVLSWKGVVFASQRRARLVRSVPELAPVLAELRSTASCLATLAFTVPDPNARAAQTRQEVRLRQIQELTDRKEELERKLAGLSAEFQREQATGRLTPDRLQAALPEGTALIDFLEYTDYQPPPEGKTELKRGRHLGAFVVRPNRRIEQVDLGPVEPIAAVIQEWRKDFGWSGPGQDNKSGSELRRLVWQRLEPHLEGVKVLLISPDGPMARFPWPALPGREPGTYLVEELAVAVAPVPQLLPELLEPHPPAEAPEPSLLLVGDVDFGGAASAGALAVRTRSAPRGGVFSKEWPRLPGTRDEIVAIKELFLRRYGEANVTDRRQQEATEEETRTLAPKYHYVHFATHGFFAPPELRSALATRSKGDQWPGTDLFSRQDVAGFHPGLLSGLVLAGANRPVDPELDDGILTALEVAELDLGGVELAVLSACETGLGESAGGEGLLGLQRAFQTAGARSVVASLWQVKDDAALSLMVDFYENLWTKRMSKLESLRHAQLSMLREGIKRSREGAKRGLTLLADQPASRNGRLPPYYWAAFVLSGDWR